MRTRAFGIMFLAWIPVLAGQPASAGTDYNLSVNNTTGLDLTATFVSGPMEGNANKQQSSVYCWYSKDMVISQTLPAKTTGPQYETQTDIGNSCITSLYNKFAFLFALGEGTVHGLAVFGGGGDGGPNIEPATVFNQSGNNNLAVSISGNQSGPKKSQFYQTISVQWSAPWQVAANGGVAIKAANLTGGNTPVYRVTVTGAQFTTGSSPGQSTNNALLLQPYQVQGSPDGTTWTTIGYLLPPSPASFSSNTFQLAPATFYYQPTPAANYSLLRVTQCIATQQDNCTTTAPLSLAAISPPQAAPKNLPNFTINANPASGTGNRSNGANGSVVANGMAQLPITISIVDGHTNQPIDTTLDWLYQNLYFANPLDGSLITNLYSSSGYVVMTDQAGPYSSPATPSAASILYYFSTSAVGSPANGSFVAKLSINGQNACGSQTGCENTVTINGTKPTPLAPTTTAFGSITFSGSLYSPLAPVVPTYLVGVNTSQPMIGMIDQYLALWHCADNQDKNAVNVSAGHAAVVSPGASVLKITQSAASNCQTYSYTVLDLNGTPSSQ